MASLEGWGSAIELHPHFRDELRVRRPLAAFTESGRQDSNLRSSAPKADALATTLRPGAPSLARRPMVECRAPAARRPMSRCSRPAWTVRVVLAGFGVDSRVTVGLPRLSVGQLRTAFIAHHRSQQRAQHSRAIEP